MLYNLFGVLIEQVDKLVIVDNFYGRHDISKRSKGRLIQFTNPNYWIEVNETRPTKKRDRLIREFKSLFKKYKLENTKEVLTDKIKLKYYNLLGIPAIV